MEFTLEELESLIDSKLDPIKISLKEVKSDVHDLIEPLSLIDEKLKNLDRKYYILLIKLEDNFQ